MPARRTRGERVRWYTWMVPTASAGPAGVARIITSTTIESAPCSLETRRVLAHSRDDQPVPVQRAHDREYVQPEDAGPQEHERDDCQASGPEGDDDEQLHKDRDSEEQCEFSCHQHETMFRVPLHLGVVSGEKERDDGKRPHVG